MNKKVIILSTSMRKNANSDILANEFANGAKEAGNLVIKINLREKNISFCQGCLACQKTQKCIINDDAIEIANLMKDADVIVWATPVYYYSMSGQMKTLIDRLNPLYTSDYKFKDIYLLATAADSDISAINGTISGVQGWIDCLSGTNLKGVVKAVGVTSPADIKHYNHYLEEAFKMGKNV